jgi:hypothetical protein
VISNTHHLGSFLELAEAALVINPQLPLDERRLGRLVKIGNANAEAF